MLPWIDRMGTGWWAIALFLGIANFAGFVISRQIMPNADPQNMDDAFKIALEATKHPQWPLAMLLQLGSLAGITLFGLLDIVHRRGNFLWLAPLFLCTCFSLGFLILPMYVLSVRTKEKLSR